MKKRYLLVLCLVLLLVFSSCQLHIDTNPWPASPEGLVPETTQTILPGNTQTPNVNLPAVTHTPTPSNDDVKPGFNG